MFVFFKTEALLELESNSSLNRALLSVLKNSFFEKKPLNWKPVKYELVINTKLTEEFQRKFTFSNLKLLIKKKIKANMKKSLFYDLKLF